MQSGYWTRILNLLSAALLWIAYFGDGAAGQFDANFTLQNVWGRLQSDSRSIIQCLSDTNYKKIKFSRKLDTGQGARLPKLSQQFMQAKPVFARILFMPGEDKLNRFGAFQCKIVTGGVSTEIITLKLPPSTEAELDALDPYQVASVGDTVELEVNVSKKLELPVKWRHNGVDVPEWDGELRVEIEDAQIKDAGVYETYYEGRRSEGVHALTRLIIRSCPVDMYGKDCDQECPPCYNGGICHDTWGVCVCPAGFTGPNCEIACGGNHFGAECSKFCSPPQNNSNTDELCASHLFCKPDPYGCSCAPGFKGSSCMEHCEPGWYGADCKQPCHCAYGISSCNRITGACSGGCAKGWRGLSCQIEDPNATNTVETTTMVYCPLGWYGPSCERECHCSGNEHCHVVTGLCPSGCEEGWGGHSCGTCRPGRFGDNCEFICHCEGGHHNCDKDGFCHGGCEAGWAGFTCQTECTPGRFGTNCASTCHCHENSTAPCDKITGVCEGDCEAGYMGEDCQTLCPQNKWGINCVNECICLNGGQCNRNDGSCACEGRWKGLTCNESEPQIIAAADQEVNAGQQVFISCTADAVPEPVMQISPSSGEDDDLKVVVRTLEQNQYQAVIKVKPKDPGQLEFHCSARNPHGYDMKKMIITVIEPPKLTTPPWLLSKTNLSLTVGWRDWEFGKDIGGSATDRIEYMVKYRQTEESTWERVDGWSTEVTNTINDLTPNTQYEIAVKCRRLAKGGEGGVSPGLFVKTDCGVPTMDGLAREVLPAFISENSVTLTWKKPYEGPLRCTLEGYYLTYHPEADESILQAIDLDGEIDTAQLEDLTPNTAYVIRLYAVTAVEKSKYFVELTLRTAETIPDPVTHLECKAVEEPAGLLLVSWEAPSDMNGVIKGYIVNYTLTDRGHCGLLSDEDTGTRQALSEDTEITLSNLHPYSVYNVSVQARTSAGEGEAVSVSAATAEAEPDEPPLNVRVISSTSTSLEYRWDPVPCENANGIISHYVYMMAIPTDIYPLHLKLKKRSLDVPFPNASLHVVEGLQVEIKNLQPYTEYGFMVSGVNRAGIGVFSEILFHKTEEDIPGKPQYLVVNTVSAHEIGLCWSEPEVSNGQIRQYHIQLWDHKMSTVAADLVYNVTTNEDDQRLTSVVENLTPATDFFIKIRAGTKAGWGDFCDPVSGRTLDGIPGEPAEVSVLDNGLRFLNVTWQEPFKKNGAVLAYKIKYRPVLTLDPVFNATPYTEKETEVEDSSATEVTLVDLHPSTEYEISVAAKTSAGYGPQARVMAWTVILGDHVSPSLRTLDVKVTNETIPIAFSTTGSTSVYKYQVIVEDSRNKEPIDESQLSDYDTAVVQKGLPYYIAAELDPRNVTEEGEQSFVVGDRKVWGGYKNVHLNPGHEYKIRIRTLVFKDDEIKTVLSDPEKETAGSFYVEINENDDPKIAGFDLLPFILILLGLLVFVIAVTFLTSYAVCMSRRRKKKSSSLSTNEFGRSESLTFSVMYKGPDSEMVGGPIVNDGYRTLPITEKPASLRHSRSDSKIARGIRIESLQEYLLNALATNQLAEEFQKLVEGQISAWTIARKSMNVKKNRYGNILPYDRYRVVLQTAGKNDSDYINASYIDGYRRSREYIITQGPLCNTVDDFWRMVWQENAPVIVMLTELMENGKKKCTKYWPDDSMMSGDIQILLIHSEECTDYVVRTILMRKLDEVSTHRVQQYQFTAWPDRSVPLNTNYFIKFLKRIREDHPVMGGPIVVHCSAGAGRSGTYVAIDALYQQAAEEKRVEVFRFVNNARHQRTRLVQTLEQYTFIYEALIEAFQFEDTTIPLDKIGTYLKELNHMSTLDNRALIRKQYHKLNRTQKKVETSRCSVALSESNIFRNRDPLIVPLDAARVSLRSLDLPDEPSDYINAVYVNGYRKKNAYVATQMPLTHTIEDFWCMIYKLKSSLIVMLNDTDESKELDVGIYWPELGDCRYGDFDVQVITCEEQGDFTTRVMMLSHCEKKNEDPLKVIQLQYNGWSSELKPASMLKLLDTAEMAYEISSGGPITVHCMDGATRTGLFIAAKNVCDQIRTDSALDVYQIVKSIRTNRPDFIPNSDQYRFLFEIAQELISE